MKVLAQWNIGRHRVGLEFKLADLWLGAFYARKGDTLHVWICVLPCLPLHLELEGA